MSAKAQHKELKSKVNQIENVRRNDRSSTSWYELRTLKKLKLKAKEKINATKQQFFIKEMTASQTADRHGISNNRRLKIIWII